MASEAVAPVPVRITVSLLARDEMGQHLVKRDRRGRKAPAETTLGGRRGRRPGRIGHVTGLSPGSGLREIWAAGRVPVCRRQNAKRN